MASAQGLCTSFKRQAITLVETTLTTGQFEGLSVVHNFAVVRMITTSKTSFATKSDAEILNSLKIGFQVVTWILSVKRERLILLLLWGGRQYVAAVDLLDENEVFLKKI